MRINNNKQLIYDREIQLSSKHSSYLLLGARMTGKTRLLSTFAHDAYINLLDPVEELKYRAKPEQLKFELEALPKGSRIMIDEIQKIPSLLNYVQMFIEEKKQQFFLTGSSARKLRRGGANLLGGRALDKKIHPLTEKELGNDFIIKNVLQFGTLPKISVLLHENNKVEAAEILMSYYTTYLKEEIQAEALVRKLDSFQRFLPIAAQANAQMIEYSNISRECSVPMATVKEYYQILEDTLIGRFLWPLNRSERKKARPKFYFFDCGVLRAIQQRLHHAPLSEEIGFLFETWFINELQRISDYTKNKFQLALWREGHWEIDCIVEGGYGPLLAFELKSGKQIKNMHSLEQFRKKFPKVPLYIVSLLEERSYKTENGVSVIPWRDALGIVREL